MIYDDTLTEEQWSSLVYFYRYKGDLTRWTGWGEALAKLREANHPIATAYDDAEKYKKVLDTLLA